MQSKNIFPILGMNTVSDTARQHGNFVRLANNVNINANGTIELRAGKDKVTDTSISHLWQSPLHKDVFGLYDGYWCMVNPHDWTPRQLAEIGNAPLYHALVNNRVIVAGKNGLYEYDGHSAKPLTIPTPPPPMVQGQSQGQDFGECVSGLDETTHKARTRVIAISYLAGQKEGGLSSTVKIDADSVTVTLPMVFDKAVTHINIYTTEQGGAELKLLASVPKDEVEYRFDTGAILGKPATTQHLDPMMTGKYLALWRGRLVVAKSNVIYFSEPLNYHLTDERYNYIAMPQRVTFLEVVDGGMWVGQTTGVAFLQGVDIDEMSISHKAVQAPIADSSTQMPSETMGELSNGGSSVALWLSANGYCVGTSDGSVVEYHAGVMSGITGTGSTVQVGQRVVTAIT